MLNLVLVGLALALPAQATVYYIDAAAGDDGNDGLTQESAWQTPARVNQTRLLPGDQVLFSRGQVHVGKLVLSAEDSGTPAAPIVIGSYGSGRATLYTAAGDGVVLVNASYVTISGLDVAGPGWSATNDGSRGIVLTGDTHHCIVEHLTASGFHKAGVRLENMTHDNAITFVTAEHNGYIGLHISGDYQLVSDCRALSNHGDLTITNNWSGSGILVDDASYVTVEYSEAAYNGDAQPWTGNGPVGIWCWNADHITFRHCISHHNTRGQGDADGGGFDLDGGTTHSLIEHCYSYNNTGPGFMVYNFKWQNIPNRNNVIRYCVSENDGQGGVFLGTSGVALENIEVHNVTAFNTNGARVMYNSSGTKKNVNLRNNIFVTTGKLTINGNGINLQGNCYYSSSGTYSFGSYGGNFAAWAAATGDEMYNGTLVGLQANPQLTDFGNGTKLTNPRQLHTLRSYSPAFETAPVINAGLDLPALFGINPGDSDFIGAGIPIGAFDMGAYEFHPTPLPDVTPPTVAVAAPLEGATVADMILVAAEVTDEPAGSGVAGVQFQLDGGALGEEITSAPYSFLCDTTTFADGPHTLTAVARDFAGNTASVSVTITVNNTPAPPPDTTAPTIVFSAPTEGATVSGSLTLSADAWDETGGSGLAGVQFQLDGVALGEEITSAPYSFLCDTTTVADGPHTLTAVARDFAGNTASASVTITVANTPAPPPDITAPTIAFSDPTEGDTVSGSLTLSADAWDETGGSGLAGVQFQLDGVALGGEIASAPYSFLCDTTTVADGPHTLTAVARDFAGNTASASVTITVANTPAPPPDITAPTIAFSDPTEGDTVSGSLTLSADAWDETGGSGLAGVQFQLDGVALGGEIASAPYSLLCDTTAVADGPHTLTAVARDSAGNTASASVTITVANTPAPPPDVTAPAVAFATPTEGASFSGAITLFADAWDEAGGSGLAGVQFQLDGADLGDEITAAPYSLSWDSTTAVNGVHTLTAIARDFAGNTGTASVTVTIENPLLNLGPIILDNADANGVAISTGWSASASVAGYYGTNYLSATAGSKAVRFTPTIPKTGTYDVHVRWTSHTNRATNAPIDVNHAAGTTTFSVNMRSNGGAWVLLGSFRFDAGESGNVRVRADAANGYVVADAVQFVPR